MPDTYTDHPLDLPVNRPDNAVVRAVDALAQPEPAAARVQTTEQSRSQIANGTFIVSLTGKFMLFSPLRATYETYRRMRNHPTVSMVREAALAPILAGEEHVEAQDGATDEMVALVQRQWTAVRDDFVQQALCNCLDYGWSSWEKVWEFDGQYYVLKALKQLLPDITALLVDIGNGALVGLKQPVVNALAAGGATGLPIDLDLRYCLVLSWRVEGSQWYGQSELERVRTTFNDWSAANEGANRYDQFIAGSHWVVYYPREGYSNINGVEKANSEVAATLLESLESSGSLTLPTELIQGVNAAPGWRVELISDSGQRQPGFIERLKYFDTMFCRGLHQPERALTEGTFGTKAEAEAHADLAITIAENKHRWLVDNVNRNLVDQLLVMNFGPDAAGLVRIKASPMVDEQRAFYRQLFMGIMAKLDLSTQIDVDALADALDVPKLSEKIDVEAARTAQVQAQAQADAAAVDTARETVNMTSPGTAGGQV